MTLQSLFETQVRITPNAVALTLNDQHLTYAELNLRANRLAHHLVGLGVKAETLVGLRIERSLEMVIAILAILKAGGAYIPFDLSCPSDRLALLFKDSDIKILLTERTLLQQLPPHTLQICLVDELAGESDLLSPNLPARSSSENLAYVIYTSGSTGKPKGVLVTHANVVRLFESTNHWFQFCSGDVWTLFHSYAFDFSVWELWGALLYGGRLVVVPFWVSRSPESFYELVCREKVTVLNQTPSAFDQFMLADEEATFHPTALRFVIFGGEALGFQKLKPWFDRHGDLQPRLINMYGITETTVHVTYRPVCRADLASDQGSLIGCPIPDLQIYVLDESGNPAAVGQEGEIYVGGEGVARGYLHRPELTSQRFLKDPFGGQPGALLYRTGDLARRLPTGDIQYLGRMDDQLKIRGFRIELGEIEAALMAHHAIRHAVVLPHGEVSDRRLHAYVVANQSIDLKELRAFLRKQLPAYMVPSAFSIIDAIPLTTNGKIDRVKLRSGLVPELPSPTAMHFAPRNQIEEDMKKIWQETLGLQRLCIHDSFFDVGGHSILAAKLLIRIEKVFKKKLSITDLLHLCTVEKIAAYLRDPSAVPSHSSIVPMHQGTQKLAFFCVPGAGDSVLRFRDLAMHMGDITFIGLQPKTLEESRDEYRLQDTASNYLKQLRLTQPEGPYFLGGFCFGAIVAFEMAQQLQANGEVVGLLAMIEPMADMFQNDFLATQMDRCRFHLRKLISKPTALKSHLISSARNVNERICGLLRPNERTQIGDRARGMAAAYQVKSYNGRVALFLADDTYLSVRRGQDPRMRWTQAVTGTEETYHVPGNHSSLIHEPHAKVLGDLLLKCLHRARARAQPETLRMPELSGQNLLGVRHLQAAF